MDFSKIIDKDLIFSNKNFPSAEEAIRFLALQMVKKKIVKEDFVEAVLEREKKYPTGLYLGKINVAIPHADIKYALKSSISILTLSKPLMFGRMDNPGEKIPVSIIFLLSISDPTRYISFLSNLTETFSNKIFVKSLLKSNTDEIAMLLRNTLKSKIGIKIPQENTEK